MKEQIKYQVGEIKEIVEMASSFHILRRSKKLHDSFTNELGTWVNAETMKDAKTFVKGRIFIDQRKRRYKVFLSPGKLISTKHGKDHLLPRGIFKSAHNIYYFNGKRIETKQKQRT